MTSRFYALFAVLMAAVLGFGCEPAPNYIVGSATANPAFDTAAVKSRLNQNPNYDVGMLEQEINTRGNYAAHEVDANNDKLVDYVSIAETTLPNGYRLDFIARPILQDPSFDMNVAWIQVGPSNAEKAVQIAPRQAYQAMYRVPPSFVQHAVRPPPAPVVIPSIPNIVPTLDYERVERDVAETDTYVSPTRRNRASDRATQDTTTIDRDSYTDRTPSRNRGSVDTGTVGGNARQNRNYERRDTAAPRSQGSSFDSAPAPRREAAPARAPERKLTPTVIGQPRGGSTGSGRTTSGSSR